MNEVMLTKGHVNWHVHHCFGRHYLTATMHCPVLCNVTWTQCAGSKQSYILALRYVIRDERMIGWGRISNGGMKRKEEGEGAWRDRLDRKGGSMKEGGVRDEGEKGVDMVSQQVKSPLVWQLPACTLLSNGLSIITVSSQLLSFRPSWAFSVYSSVNQGVLRLCIKVGCFFHLWCWSNYRASSLVFVCVCVSEREFLLWEWQ